MTQENTDDYVDGWKWKIPNWLKDKANNITEEYRELVRQQKPDTKRDFENLFTRAIVKVSNDNIPDEHLLVELIGKQIDSTSDCKKVRQEVEDIYFKFLTEEPMMQFKLQRSVNEYNRRHGHLGKHMQD
jgi:hypothetical protein